MAVPRVATRRGGDDRTGCTFSPPRGQGASGEREADYRNSVDVLGGILGYRGTVVEIVD